MTENWRVEIEQQGRGGRVYYYEVEHSTPISFDWEFGEGDTVALIFCPSATSWNANYPWAENRRSVILDRVGKEIIRQRAQSHGFSVQGDMMYIR